MIRFERVSKRYPNGREALSDLNFEIAGGEMVFLTGRSGAGKSSVLKLIALLERPTRGMVLVNGENTARLPLRRVPMFRRHIGIVLQSTGIDPYLTVDETVTMYADFYPHPRPVDEIIELVGLTAKRGERVVHLSGGQQRRLDMAVALAGDPELLFLDEPTTGFDPSARREAWEVVKSLAALGKTVLLTTHYMDEAQFLADDVVVIANGRVVAQGPPSTLGFRDHAKVRVRYRIPDGAAPPADLTGPPGSDGFVEISVDDAVTDVHRLLTWAIEQGVDLDGFEVTRPSLEDVYLSLTDPTSGGDLAPAPENETR